MHSVTTSIRCPRCTQPASVTLFTTADLLADRDRDDIVFDCSSGCPRPSDPELFLLWRDRYHEGGDLEPGAGGS